MYKQIAHTVSSVLKMELFHHATKACNNHRIHYCIKNMLLRLKERVSLGTIVAKNQLRHYPDIENISNKIS